MSGDIKLIRSAYITLFFILITAVCRFIIWERINEIVVLKRELEISKRLYLVKEANYENVELNRAALSQNENERSGLIEIERITDASLFIGKLLQDFELNEISSSYDKQISQTNQPGLSVVRTKVNSAFIGDYEQVMKFLRAVKNEKYAYFFNGIQLSSAGMSEDSVSVKIELLFYSIYKTPEAPTFNSGEKNYFEEYGYENPFYYIEN